MVAGFFLYFILKDWRPGGIPSRLPQYSFWAFTLGWVVYYSRNTYIKKEGIFKISLVLVTFLFSVIQFGLDTDFLRTVFSVLTVAILMYVEKVRVNKVFARIMLISSQASLTIYLMHLPFIKLFDALHLRIHKSGFYLFEVLGAWFFAFVGCLAFWLVSSSIVRAWRHEVMDMSNATVSHDAGMNRAGSAGGVGL